MYRDDRDLFRKYLRGVPVPLAKMKEVIAAECKQFLKDGACLDVELVLRFLGELRPDGSKRGIGRSSTISREELLPLLNYVRGGRAPRAKLEEIIAYECYCLHNDKIYQLPEVVLRILDGLRPEGASRKARGR
jgi:hypothetical protein